MKNNAVLVFYTLEELKQDSDLRDKLKGKTVRIWSAEHDAYWRHNGGGYTTDGLEAGAFEFSAAYDSTCHCGPEKRIEFRIIPDEAAPPLPGVMNYREVKATVFSDTPLGETEVIVAADERIVKCAGRCGRHFAHKKPWPKYENWICVECIQCPPQHRNPQPTAENCVVCDWTNVSLINVGEFGKPRLVCQGCVKRIFDAVFPLMAIKKREA